MAEHQQAFTETGAALVVVGNGEPIHIPELRKATGYTGELVCDSSLKSFEALGFTRNISGLLSSKVILGGLKAFSSGHRQKGVQGDAMQLGGAAVIGPDSKVYYYYCSKQAADHPPVGDIIEACLKGEMS